MKIRIDARKAVFAGAVATALSYGAGSALAEERGAREGKHYYCIQAASVDACQRRCEGYEYHVMDTFISGTCCCRHI